MNAPDRKQIGKHLQTIRKEAGYKSAAAFADRMGYNPDTYTCYEQGKSMFSYEQAWDMADALDVTLDELGGRDFDPASFNLTRDEAKLVDDYRRADEADRPALASMAAMAAYAGEAKNESQARTLNLAGNDVTEVR